MTRTLDVLFILFVSFGLFLSATGLRADEALFSDDFEGHSLGNWDYAVPLASISDNVVRSGAKALHIPYEVPEGPPAHRDNNRFVQKDMSEFGLSDFYVSGCFYLESSAKPTSHRKLFYLFSHPHSEPRWDIVVSAWDGVDGRPIYLAVGSNSYPYSTLRVPIDRIARGTIQYDQWHCLRLNLRLNTPGQTEDGLAQFHDGRVELYLDDELVAARDEVALRIDDKPVGRVRIGAQLDRAGDTERRYENRYWDDIEIGVGWPTSRPKPPSNVVVD